ncbi:MAG: glycosyltransferase family 4 protein [Acidobacteriota bacterium]
MKRVGIVLPRWHPSVVGGAEVLGWQWATLLKETYPTDLLTTCALDLNTWANDLPAQTTEEHGVIVRRFRVSQGRTAYWHELHVRLLSAVAPPATGGGRPQRFVPWSQALQEEFIRRQGPYSSELCDFLAGKWQDYRALIFLPYLYATTYFPARLIPPSRFVLAPLLHDEAPARLSVYGEMARRARAVLWNTPAEQSFGESIWGQLPGRVAGMGIDLRERKPAELGFPYLLYSGRIDAHKGCDTLVNYFLRYKQERPSPLRLVLTGKDELGLPSHADIDFRGFISEEEKFELMAGARLFVLLSPNESLSISTLEAMVQKTPVLVSSRAPVLADHVRLSGGGFTCSDYPDFARAVDRMLDQPGAGAEMGRRGHEYVVAGYSRDRVAAVLRDTIEECGSTGFRDPS